MKSLSKIILSIFILFTLVACGDSKKVDKEKIREDLYITFTETEITIAKDNEFSIDSIIIESNGLVSLPDPIDTTTPGVYELTYTVSSFDYPEVEKTYDIRVTILENLYPKNEINIACKWEQPFDDRFTLTYSLSNPNDLINEMSVILGPEENKYIRIGTYGDGGTSYAHGTYEHYEDNIYMFEIYIYRGFDGIAESGPYNGYFVMENDPRGIYYLGDHTDFENYEEYQYCGRAR